MLSLVASICAQLSRLVGLERAGHRQWAEGLSPLEAGQVVLGARCRTKTEMKGRSSFVIRCHTGHDAAWAKRCEEWEG